MFSFGQQIAWIIMLPPLPTEEASSTFRILCSVCRSKARSISLSRWRQSPLKARPSRDAAGLNDELILDFSVLVRLIETRRGSSGLGLWKRRLICVQHLSLMSDYSSTSANDKETFKWICPCASSLSLGIDQGSNKCQVFSEFSQTFA